MNSSELIEGDEISLYPVSLEELGALLSVPSDVKARRKDPAIEPYFLYIRTDEGLRKVARIFVEFDESFEQALK